MGRIAGRQRSARGDALGSLRGYTHHTLAASVFSVFGLPVYSLIRSGVDPVRATMLLAGLAAVGLVHWRRIIKAMRDPWRPLPWSRFGPTIVLSLALNWFALWTYPAGVAWAFVPALCVSEALFGRPPSAGWRIVAPVALVAGLSTGYLALLAPREGLWPMWRTALAVAVVLVAVSYGESLALRQWGQALELDKARRDAADLATTRERLRLAEDLHDILGHALEVVSLKSELAIRLADADPERARAEMTEVQRLARGALQDVRELARSQRTTDLAAEVVGARNLLASAGILCEFTGRPESLDRRAGELLGRVLREAVTNLLRHANARTCTVTLDTDADTARLRVVNDGVVPLAGQDGGSGLHGLARRVDEAGGTFSASAGRSGTFEVEAVVPRVREGAA